MNIKTVSTQPIEGQKPGTSGLRKKVTEVDVPNYLENFVQSVFDTIHNEVKGSTLVVGGDGRYFNDVAIQKIIKISAANGVSKVLVGQNGILSTPAVSAVIRARKCLGGIVLTASHNPGGLHGDFGIKYNCSNGGPAPESVTDVIYQKTRQIKEYRVADIPEVDLSKVGVTKVNDFTVEIIDSIDDYISLLKTIFDFDKIRQLLSKPGFSVLFDSMSGVTGPYAKRIFVDVLGAPSTSLQNCEPSPDFNGGHPDPNLVYAKSLVDRMYSKTETIQFGAAWDGDGDRNMVMGHNFFVTPSDSLAVLAANASSSIPFFSASGPNKGLVAVSRSMPTSAAVDRVAQKLGIPLYEVPTGWKFFGNLMDKYEKEGTSGFVCGEESFGTGSAHIREKDGIWAVLAWLSVLAEKNHNGGDKFVTVADVVTNHWKEYGRNYYCRYDYEGVSASGANEMMAHLVSLAKSLKEGDALGSFTVKFADEFEYKDPVDGSISSHQGMRFVFTDGSRFVVRLSGTGSVGATIRLYLEKYEPAKIDLTTEEALGSLISTALSVMTLKKYIGTEDPTVIT
eukprot:TRINITY_DN1420_c0_g1_i1.p1 TRINITY_DN1420_c0_g1~~TRINITY_DN1420_c0_g1_i1.p1  ORF type:complete len:564 (-),score=126.55 TRINITY_DN1420_c0_g1_i1:72-1763(-)